MRRVVCKGRGFNFQLPQKRKEVTKVGDKSPSRSIEKEVGGPESFRMNK